MHRLGDYYTELLQQELNDFKEREEIYYRIELKDGTKTERKRFKTWNI